MRGQLWLNLITCLFLVQSEISNATTGSKTGTNQWHSRKFVVPSSTLPTPERPDGYVASPRRTNELTWTTTTGAARTAVTTEDWTWASTAATTTSTAPTPMARGTIDDGLINGTNISVITAPSELPEETTTSGTAMLAGVTKEETTRSTVARILATTTVASTTMASTAETLEAVAPMATTSNAPEPSSTITISAVSTAQQPEEGSAVVSDPGQTTISIASPSPSVTMSGGYSDDDGGNETSTSASAMVDSTTLTLETGTRDSALESHRTQSPTKQADESTATMVDDPAFATTSVGTVTSTATTSEQATGSTEMHFITKATSKQLTTERSQAREQTSMTTPVVREPSIATPIDSRISEHNATALNERISNETNAHPQPSTDGQRNISAIVPFTFVQVETSQSRHAILVISAATIALAALAAICGILRWRKRRNPGCIEDHESARDTSNPASSYSQCGDRTKLLPAVTINNTDEGSGGRKEGKPMRMAARQLIDEARHIIGPISDDQECADCTMRDSSSDDVMPVPPAPPIGPSLLVGSAAGQRRRPKAVGYKWEVCPYQISGCRCPWWRRK